MKTVESMSGIRMDHYVEVDFEGFEKLINVLGGVDITTTKDIKDPDSHLNLKAGEHTLSGKQALGLVRTRHGVGDGSDLGRIQLQQAFIKALIEQVKSVGILSSPTKLYDLAETATDAVTTDSELDSVKNLASFAGGLKGISPKNMTMVTMPVQYDPDDLNRVLVDEDKSQQVWAALKADRTIPKSATKGTASGAADGVVAASWRVPAGFVAFRGAGYHATSHTRPAAANGDHEHHVPWAGRWRSPGPAPGALVGPREYLSAPPGLGRWHQCWQTGTSAPVHAPASRGCDPAPSRN